MVTEGKVFEINAMKEAGEPFYDSRSDSDSSSELPDCSEYIGADQPQFQY